ncbi:sensor histidine kinase [Halalkalibacter wakoensis JCM 9140]|uniref:histidine kinase n=1 Tax=Halalkalibacter wakoensis JCM 9140 TaxID=1236970 RepID=W4Q0Z4_9BACI|nr:PAS domain-containing sensor histidine kinase [Halalkalibacter wakoensis]GAE25751.1 sensor histidine kinase [Halalkalibacter wakoensis JCM 9140]
MNLLFKNTEDAIFIYNLKDKEIIRRNPAFTRMFGYDANDRLHVTCLIPPDRQFEFNKLIYQLAEGQSIVDFKTVRKREDGSYIDVSMTVSPMHNVTGELLCAAIIRDISDQTKAERELKKAKKELQEIMEEYRGLIFKFKKEKNDFVYTLMDGKVLYERNDDPKKFIGRPVQEAYQCSQGDLFNKYNERAWLGEEVEFQFEDENGMVFLTSLKPIWQQGQVTEVLGNVVDITSLIKAEELLRRTEKLSVVGELAAGFAHEIRNPLTTLKGFLQLIQLDADEKNMNYVKIMLNEIDRLEMITNEFMVVAKPQAVKYEMEDMEQMIESVTQFLQPQALLNNIEMINLVEGPLEKICCDPHQMRQVFINIYKNAMEAMPSGGMITTNLALNTNYMTISITDQGGGIPAELIPKLGEPFYTLKEKGTGLGLMVSKKIIETHGGELQIESETNVGTTMTIYLPIDSIYKGENKLLERQKEGEIV